MSQGSSEEPTKRNPKKDWVLDEGAFQRLLHWLDGGTDSGGERYLEMQRRLLAYFDRKNCPGAAELADETLNRVARRLQDVGEITDTEPAHYCYIVAKFIFLEHLRRAGQFPENLDEVVAAGRTLKILDPSHFETDSTEERVHSCLESCLEKLAASERELILSYYQGDKKEKIEGRRRLAERLGINMNTLSIRSCRIREKVEACVRKCCSE